MKEEKYVFSLHFIDLLAFILFSLNIMVVVFLLLKLPDQIPSHLSRSNQIESYSTKYQILVLVAAYIIVLLPNIVGLINENKTDNKNKVLLSSFIGLVMQFGFGLFVIANNFQVLA